MTKRTKGWVLCLVWCVVGVFGVMAQDVGAVETGAGEDFLVTIATRFPWLVTVLLVMGGLRMVFKPVMLAVEWYVKQTPGEADDVAIMKFQAGPIYKVLSIALDFLASVKLPVVKKPQP